MYALQKARKSVLSHPQPLYTAEECKQLKGIGPTIAAKIDTAVLRKRQESSRFHFQTQQSAGASSTRSSERSTVDRANSFAGSQTESEGRSALYCGREASMHSSGSSSLGVGTRRPRLYHPHRGKAKWQILMVMNFHERLSGLRNNDETSKLVSVDRVISYVRSIEEHCDVIQKLNHSQVSISLQDLQRRYLVQSVPDEATGGVLSWLTSEGREVAERIAGTNTAELYHMFLSKFGSTQHASPLTTRSNACSPAPIDRTTSGTPPVNSTARKRSSAHLNDKKSKFRRDTDAQRQGQPNGPSLSATDSMRRRKGASPRLAENRYINSRVAIEPVLHVRAPHTSNSQVASASVPRQTVAMRQRVFLNRNTSDSLSALRKQANLVDKSNSDGANDAAPSETSHRVSTPTGDGVKDAEPSETSHRVSTPTEAPPMRVASSDPWINLCSPTPTLRDSVSKHVFQTSTLPREETDHTTTPVGAIPMASLSPAAAVSPSSLHSTVPSSRKRSRRVEPSARREATAGQNKNQSSDWLEVERAMKRYGPTPFHGFDALEAVGGSSVSPVRQGAWELVLLLDSREQVSRLQTHALQTKLLEKKILLETRALPLGDCMWIIRRARTATSTVESSKVEYVQEVIVERKTTEDLWSSIKDGRYVEQKARLKKCGIENLVYLVEGSFIQGSGANVKRMWSALAASQVTDNFMIQHTDNMFDTVNFYARVHRMLKRGTTHSPHWEGPNGQLTYSEFKDRFTKSSSEVISDIFGAQLKQFRGCSAFKAKEIVKHYPVPALLVTSLDRAVHESLGKSYKDAEQVLLDIQNGVTKVNTINPKLASMIAQFYCGEY